MERCGEGCIWGETANRVDTVLVHRGYEYVFICTVCRCRESIAIYSIVLFSPLHPRLLALRLLASFRDAPRLLSSPPRLFSHLLSPSLYLSLSHTHTHTHTHILPHRSRTTTSETTTCLPSNHASWTVTPKVSCARKYSSTKSCLSLLKLYLEIVIECGERWGVAFIHLPPSTPPPHTPVPSLARPGTMQ